ncbi:hypothetical protein [Methylobacterium haplocladii]|uniref:SinR family protein n=1 Tax=Methylobacterium haplocladii TaxID=1176176 RepID=A0A512IW71_9HYPH|nr:hypothetical protein [Methylobacterium haplocladii]GEP01936.1 hypothetical protein MHA02_43230 [Methylobacterium haplocladii]GLS61376.1 hypothetical protein GCM10007887_40840 [Methylobacterium haplocladii]
MTIYLATFDMKAMSHDYAALYEHLQVIDAHQAQSSAWMIEAESTIIELSNHLLALMDKDDSLLIIEITKSTHWAATHLSEQTGEWLIKRRP